MNFKKLAVFLEENPNLTIVGLAWACYWRMILTLLGVYAVLGTIAIFFAGIASL